MKKTPGKIGTAGLCAAILAVFLLISPSAQATSGNVNFFVGQKSMDDSDYWDPTDDQTEFGLIFDMSERRWPLIVTYHPAYLLRNLPDKARAWEDLCFMRKTMAGLR